MEIIALFKKLLVEKTNGVSKLTLKNYLSDLRHFISWYENTTRKSFTLENIKPDVISLYSNSMGAAIDKGNLMLETQLSSSSMKRHLSSLRKFFAVMQEQKQISQNPFAQIAPEANILPTDYWHLKSFKDSLFTNNSSKLTVKNYLSDIQSFARWYEESILPTLENPLTQTDGFYIVSSDIVEEYKKRLIEIQGAAPRTINRKLSSLRKYLEFASKKGFITPSEIAFNPLKIQSSASQGGTLQTQRGEFSLEDIKSSNQKSAISNQYSVFPPFRLLQKLIIYPYLNLEDKAASAIAVLIAGKTYTNGLKLPKKAFNNLNAKNIVRAQNLTISGILGARNVEKKFFAPASISLRGLPVYKKLIHHARFTRPDWYKRYHNYPFVHYMHFTLLVIFASGVGAALYQNLVLKKQTPTFAAATAPPRIMSFQGRLTDNLDNPITSSQRVRFMIYSNLSSSGAAELWEEARTITPDQDGIFSVLLGADSTGANAASCGSFPPGSPYNTACLIPSTVFTDNSQIWLGVTINSTSELTPRQKIATVAYATNSEFLQGQPPTTQAGITSYKNVILALDSSGNLTLSDSVATDHVFQANNGMFKISGQPLVLTTNSSSNGNIQLIPDGLGKIDLQKPLINTTTMGNIVPGGVEVNDKFGVLATESAVAAFVVNNNTTGGDIFTASSSGTPKFTIQNDGTIVSGKYVSQNGVLYGTQTTGVLAQATTASLNLCLLSGASSPTWGACPGGGADLYWNQQNGSLFANNSTVDFLAGGQSTGSAAFRVTGQANPFRGTISAASVSANTSFAGFVVDNKGVGDLIAASSSGVPNFVVQNNGNVIVGLGGNGKLTAAVIDPYLVQNQKTTGTTTLTLQTMGGSGADIIFQNQSTDLMHILQTGNVGIGVANPTGGKLQVAGDIVPEAGGTRNLGTPSLGFNNIYATNIFSTGSINGFWQQGNGSLFPLNSTLDLLVGGQSTASAKFAFINLNSGNPTATISGNLSLVAPTGNAPATTLNILNNGSFDIQTSAGGNAGLGSALKIFNGGAVLATGNTTTGATPTSGSGTRMMWIPAKAAFLAGKVTGTQWDNANIGAGAAAFGDSNTVSGDNAFAAGNLNTVSGILDSAAFGFNNTVSGFRSFAAGRDVTVSGNTSEGLGQNLTVGGTNAIVLGKGVDNSSNKLVNNTTNSLMVGFNSTVPTLYVGPASGIGTYGRVGIGTSSPLSLLHVEGNSSGGNAALIVNQTGVSTNDILTASASGISKFTISNTGAVTSAAYTNAGGILYTATTGLIGQTGVGTGSQCLLGGTIPAFGSCGTGTTGANIFQQASGLIFPNNSTVDFAIGGQATSSAKFAVLNINSGTPTASVSATATGTGLALGGDGTIQSLRNNTLTVGGASTGDIAFKPGNASTPSLYLQTGGNVGIGTTAPSKKLQVVGGSDAWTGLALGDNGGDIPTLSFRVSDNSQRAKIEVNGVNGAGGDRLGLFAFNSGILSEVVSIKGGGNVGIGTTSPTALLDVAGAASVGGQLTFRSGTAQIQSTANQVLTIGGNTTGNITLAPLNGAVGGNVVPSVNQQTDLGTSSLQWRNIYAQNFIGGTTGIQGLWQRTLGSLAPTNITDSLNLGATATSSALIHLAGTTGENSFINTGNVGIGTTLPVVPLNFAASTGDKVYLYGAATGDQYGFGVYTGELRNFFGNSSTTNFESFGKQGGGTFTELMRLTGAGNLGIGTTSPTSEIYVTRPLSFGATGKALAIFDQIENQDIFSASSSGTTRFTINNAGAIGLTSGYGSASQCLTSNGSGSAASWGTCGSGGGGSNWTLSTVNGTLSPNNNTLDLLLGGIATSSAKFAFLNMNGSASPIASISATTASGGNGNGIKIGGDGTIQSLRNNTLTIGGTTTGDIVFKPGNAATPSLYLQTGGNVGIGTTTPADKLEVSGGNLRISNTAPTLIFNQTAGVAWQYSINGDQWLVQRAGVDKFVVNNAGDIIFKGTLTNNASTDVRIGATASNSNLYLQSNGTDFIKLTSLGQLGLGTQLGPSGGNLTAKLQVYSDLGTLPAASISGKTSAPSLLVTNEGSGDIFVASGPGGLQALRIKSNGDAVFGDGGAYRAKLTFGTQDPLYTIGDKKYSTYVSSTLGIYEEILSHSIPTYDPQAGAYTYKLDFNNAPKDSDLWVLNRIIDPDINLVTVLVTGNNSARVWYRKDLTSRTITLYSDRPGEISYRLSGPRFDHNYWSTQARAEDYDIKGITAPPPPPLSNGANNDISVDPYFASITINQQNGQWILTDANGNKMNHTEAFSKAIIANIQGGFSSFQKSVISNLESASATISNLTGNTLNFTQGAFSNITASASNLGSATANTFAVATENFTIAGTSLRNYITNIVQTTVSNLAIQQFNNGSAIISPLASIDQIRTNVISPLGTNKVEVAGNFNIQGNLTASSSAFQKSIISNLESDNASIAGTLAANSATFQTSNSQLLTSNNASISGTLRAGNIIAGSIEGLDSKISSIASNLIAANSQLQTPNSQTATSSSQIYPQSPNFNLLTANSLKANFGIFEQGITSLGPITATQVTAMDSLSVGQSFTISNNAINTVGADLEIQSLKQGNIAFEGGLIRMDTDGNMKIGGSLNVLGNIAAVQGIFTGSVSANALAVGIISPLPNSDLVIKLNDGVSTPSGKLKIQNNNGNEVLSINSRGDLFSSGSATFAKLNFNLVGQAQASSLTEAVATGSAGFATLNKNQSELTIKNPLITDKSLIYITPFGDTGNKVLYLLRQVPNSEVQDGSFTVGLSGTPTTKDTQFNWLIVN